MDDVMKERIEQLVDFIMKWCLWQFHSRSWDRERQNEGILTKTMQLLCDEPIDLSTSSDRCYWVDAVYLANGFRKTYPWLNTMDKKDIKLLIQGLKDRIDYLTINESLNQELTNPLY